MLLIPGSRNLVNDCKLLVGEHPGECLGVFQRVPRARGPRNGNHVGVSTKQPGEDDLADAFAVLPGNGLEGLLERRWRLSVIAGCSELTSWRSPCGARRE